MGRKISPDKKLKIQQKRIKLLAEQIRSQEELDSLLLKIPNRMVRREVYAMYQPHIRLFVPKFEGLVASYHKREEFTRF